MPISKICCSAFSYLGCICACVSITQKSLAVFSLVIYVHLCKIVNFNKNHLLLSLLWKVSLLKWRKWKQISLLVLTILLCQAAVRKLGEQKSLKRNFFGPLVNYCRILWDHRHWGQEFVSFSIGCDFVRYKLHHDCTAPVRSQSRARKSKEKPTVV